MPCDGLLLYFSVRLDETDTHDDALFTVVGGAVGTMGQWDELERAWRDLLQKARIRSFHYKDFVGRQGDFAGWSDLKAKRFLSRIERIIDRNTGFRIAVGVDSKAHADVKRRMKGIKGYRGDSDYGLCLRWLLLHSCDVIERHFGSDFGLDVILEDGPYASGAVGLFHSLRRMTDGKQPPKHTSKYRDIAVLGKESSSLQAADAIVGIEADRLGRSGTKRTNRLSCLLDEARLESWYEGMMAEKERRRAFGASGKRSFPDLG